MQENPTILVKDLESTLSRSYYKGELEILEVKYITAGDTARQVEIELIDHPRSPKLPVICLSKERLYDVNPTSGAHTYVKVSLPNGIREGKCALVIRRCWDLLQPYYIIEEAFPLEETHVVEVKSTNNYLGEPNKSH